MKELSKVLPQKAPQTATWPCMLIDLSVLHLLSQSIKQHICTLKYSSFVFRSGDSGSNPSVNLCTSFLSPMYLRRQCCKYLLFYFIQVIYEHLNRNRRLASDLLLMSGCDVFLTSSLPDDVWILVFNHVYIENIAKCDHQCFCLWLH